MNEAGEIIEGVRASGVIVVADHASNHVPDDIDLQIAPDLLNQHIAVDIGVAGVARALGYQAILGGVSRLVIDLNREVESPNLIAITSDGHEIPGNALTPAQTAMRVDRFWHPYHDRLALLIAEQSPWLLVSLHSFTPCLENCPENPNQEQRPWEIGILYNEDDRAARIALRLLASAGVYVGDQEPYSGKLLNASMNRHAEANGIAYLGIEIRQDLISDSAGILTWTNILAPVIDACAAIFEPKGAR